MIIKCIICSPSFDKRRYYFDNVKWTNSSFSMYWLFSLSERMFRNCSQKTLHSLPVFSWVNYQLQLSTWKFINSRLFDSICKFVFIDIFRFYEVKSTKNETFNKFSLFKKNIRNKKINSFQINYSSWKILNFESNNGSRRRAAINLKWLHCSHV